MHRPQLRRYPGILVVTVAIGFMALATAVTLVIVLSGRSSAGSSGPATSAPSKPVVTLPPGCSLLTTAQIAALIPGEADTSRSSGPVVSNELTQSECEWGNWHDPNSASLPYVDLHVKATIVATPEVLDNTMRYSLGCGNPNSAAPAVAGADQTCVTNSSANQADVTARRGKLVVEVHYSYDKMLVNIINDTATKTAADIISAILKAQ